MGADGNSSFGPCLARVGAGGISINFSAFSQLFFQLRQLSE
jgi:hypothetical protein